MQVKKNSILLCLFINFTLTFSSNVLAKDIFFVKDQLIVKLKPLSPPPGLPGVTKWRHLFGQVFSVSVDNLEKASRVLQNHNDVEYVEKNYIAPKKDLTPNLIIDDYPNASIEENPLFNDPYNENVWSFRDKSQNGISVLKAYESQNSSDKNEIIVAVVDTGIDLQHEDLKDILWTNTDEIPDNGIDDDGNGIIDDINGINTIARDKAGNPTNNIQDQNGHGTHVAGTIGATQNNAKGIAGIASRVKIMSIKTVPDNGDETDVNVIESFVYAAKHGAKIINCSFGKDHNEGGKSVQESIEYIGKEYGTLVVVAAGNDSRNIDSRPTYPASFVAENMLVVASTSSNGGMSYFSNYGKNRVHVGAPGQSIYSTYPKNRYAYLSGTSMSAPTTSGVAAEVLSNYNFLGPVELKKILMDSVTLNSSWKNKLSSSGRIDLYEALTQARKFHQSGQLSKI